MHPSWISSWAAARSGAERARLEALLAATVARSRQGLDAQRALLQLAVNLDRPTTRVLHATIRAGERRLAERPPMWSALARLC